MNRVCQILNIKKPVVQAPMAWITSAELVAAVSNAGGLGTLGANAGQRSLTADAAETGRRMQEEIRKTRQLTDKPFAVNYQIADEEDPKNNIYSEAVLQAAYAEKVPCLVVSGLLNEKAIKRVKEMGFIVLYRSMMPTAEDARQAEDCGVDIIIATGYDEGGALPDKAMGTFTIVPTIVDSVNIPVLAAGGIVERRGFNAALALGAEGVFAGTAFIASTECWASDAAKEDIIQTEATDLILFAASPFFWRATPHQLAKNCLEKSMSGISPDEVYSAMNGTQGLKVAQLDGDLENGINSVSTAISLIKEIRDCRTIINDMTKDFSE